MTHLSKSRAAHVARNTHIAADFYMSVLYAACTCPSQCIHIYPRMGSLIRYSICCPEGKKPLRHPSLHSILLPQLRERAWWTRNLPLLFPSPSPFHSASGQGLSASEPCHPALTFLRAERPRGIPADELLEMLKTAKLGSVTGIL